MSRGKNFAVNLSNDPLIPSLGKTDGFTMIELMIAISIIALLASFALPNMISARRMANETSAIGSLQAIKVSQERFRNDDSDSNGITDYANSLSKLGPGVGNANLIDEVLSSGVKAGYVLTISQNGSSPWTADWQGNADPLVPGKSGDRYFYVDASGVVRYNLSQPATASDTAIGN